MRFADRPPTAASTPEQRDCTEQIEAHVQQHRSREVAVPRRGNPGHQPEEHHTGNHVDRARVGDDVDPTEDRRRREDRHGDRPAALERAQALLVGRVADTHPLLIEVRSRLVDLYRLRRDLDRADQLANQQFALCERETALPALTCLGVRNDRIETALALGRPADAVDRIAEARGFADRGGLQGDYEAVFLDYLAGMALRQLGRSDEAAQAFIHLAERSLSIVPAQHPGLLTDTMWFGWIALDLGDAELATRCAEIALTGRHQGHRLPRLAFAQRHPQAWVLAPQTGQDLDQ